MQEDFEFTDALLSAKAKETNKKRAKRRKILFWYGVSLLIVISAVSGFMLLNIHRNELAKHIPDPVPQSVKDQLDFPIYYPDQKKLPPGYTLNLKSFAASNLAAVYAIDYGKGKKLVFTDQKKPSAYELKGFLTTHLPLNTQVSTPAGTAYVGAIGKQAVVSLPTHDNSWLIITAPSNINQGQFNKVLRSIRKP